MEQVWPSPAVLGPGAPAGPVGRAHAVEPVDPVDPVATYAADERTGRPGRPWVLVNMIASADGAAVDGAGASGGLGGPADKAVFTAIRAVADVIVAGAATIVAEDYGPSRPPEPVRRMRLARGQAAAPRIAVVSASLTVDPGQRLFREAPADARPLVLTVERSDPARRQALEAVADVHTVGHEQVDWARALALLGSAAGAGTVLCEGGPRTTGQLVADDLVDELCLTVAPALLAGPAPRLAQGAVALPARQLTLARVLTEDGFLFLRYLRERHDG
jgi:riboflavin biosynthesis pyrimidine reductase